MSTEENKALVRRFYDDVINKHNVDAVDNFIATDAIDHSAPPGSASGLEGAKQQMSMFFSAFPDIRVTAEDQIAEGDKVVSRLSVRGTHKGEFMGIPPTGKEITMTAIDMVRIASGKMVEHWEEVDMLGVMQQLGAIPPP